MDQRRQRNSKTNRTQLDPISLVKETLPTIPKQTNFQQNPIIKVEKVNEQSNVNRKLVSPQTGTSQQLYSKKSLKGLIHRKQKLQVTEPLPFPLFLAGEAGIPLTPEQEKMILDAFSLFDADGSGSISCKEWRVAMKSLGFQVSKEEAKKMMDAVDVDGSGSIEYPEFALLIKEKIRDRFVKEEMIKCYSLFDIHGKGGITAKDIRRVVAELNENIMDNEINDMIEEADKDADGVVKVDDFIRMMKRTNIWVKSTLV